MAKRFIELSSGDQERLLQKVQKSEFFLLARKIHSDWFTTRVARGLKELDYPGLRFYSESPECPHKDDPEHKHLAAGPR